MKNEFEDQLTHALRAIEPSDDFAERLMARIAQTPPRVAPVNSARLRWLTVALAASVVLSAVITYEWQLRREREGLEARKQLIEALRVTGEKLDLAYRVVNSKSPAPIAASDTGA